MPIDLADYDRKAREAVQSFRGNREQARQKQIEAGNVDQGERASCCDRHQTPLPAQSFPVRIRNHCRKQFDRSESDHSHDADAQDPKAENFHVVKIGKKRNV